jgi:hypothetical protein
LFAGAAVYINLVEHPARMRTGIGPALAEFAPSYKRAAVMQVSLAIAGFLSALVAWRSRSDARWLITNPLGKTTCSKERLEPGFPTDVLFLLAKRRA